VRAGAQRLLLLVLALFFTSSHAAIQVRDDRSLTITFSTPPQRIVSLLPSLTEFVCVLGACSRLVGVDDYSNYPAPVRGIPHVGGLEDARIEAIVALRPDLVLTPTSSRALDRLQALGLKVLALEPRTFADVQRVLGVLGPVLGSADAGAAWRRMEQDLHAVARSLPPTLRGTRVYFEVGSAPYAASEASFIGELLTRIGAANVVPGALGVFPKLNPEFVVRADPEVIFVERADAAQLPQRPGWGAIRAVRDQRICAYAPAQADVLARPGPRMAEAARLMVQCLQGRFPGAAK
jgi:iron complex transport system substrate-binding protein